MSMGNMENIGQAEMNKWSVFLRKTGGLLLPLVLMFSAPTMAQVMGDGARGLNSRGALMPQGLSAEMAIGNTPQITNTQEISAIREGKAALPKKNAGAKKDNLEPKKNILEPKVSQGPLIEETNEFQDFVFQSTGKKLPMYGHSLFGDVPDTFAPVENIPVAPDYLIGPGDEIVIKAWGQVDIDFNAVVNRNGAIDLPKVGSINLAGIRYQQLQGYLKSAIGRVFRNFELSVTLGSLRSIQVFVVGQAKSPGVYTVSSLSTLVNTLFASGGPSINGSLRQIQVKRNGKVVTEFDLYELLLKGDKTRDIALMAGDVIYIPPVGRMVAISGSVNNSAVYELKNEKSSLADLIELAGGFTTTASGQKIMVERIVDRKFRKVEEFELDQSGLARQIQDGDLIQVNAIKGQFDNAVTLRGNVAEPGRRPWKQGMRVKDLIPSMDALIMTSYWKKQNQASPKVVEDLQSKIQNTMGEINWDYALIERLKKDDLTNLLIPFNLGRAIGDSESQENHLLQPGDVITIYSNENIQVPIAKRSIYVQLEGEINAAGVYKVLPGETLHQLVERVGGLTPNAFLFGAELNRNSVREMQKKRLQTMADRMETEINRNLSAKQQTALTAEAASNAKLQADAQLAMVQKIRSTEVTGRVVLEIPLQNAGMKDIPDIALEDGDRFRIPSQPSTVSVMGMVYNENAFLHRPGKHVSDYIELAGGPTRDADESRIYLLRADGSVISTRKSYAILGYFSGDYGGSSGEELMPGDTVVVPELMDRFAFTKELKDWSQILYQFALGVAGIKLLNM